MDRTHKKVVESVWDYPRPPRLERSEAHLRVVHGGVTLVESRRSLRLLETSHPPTFYIPQADIAMQCLIPSDRRSSFCEFKGVASYWTIDVSRSAEVEDAEAPGQGYRAPDAAWSYPNPTPAYRELRDHLAFYASRVDECWVDG